MRIIGGKLRGQEISAPPGRTTRPMLDRIRQALFNIIEHHNWGRAVGNPLVGANVMDAFSGTGALAFEAISRGALQAIGFEKDNTTLKVAAENTRKLGLQKKCQIMSGDTLHPPKAEYKCKLVFVCPPYRKQLIAPALAALDVKGWIAENPLIICETQKKEPLEMPENFVPVFSRFYADTAIHFVMRGEI